MRKLRWVAPVVTLMALLVVSVLYGQENSGNTPPPGPGAGGGMGRRAGGMGPGMGPGMGRMGGGMMDPERMKGMLQRMGLDEKEQAAVVKSVQSKAKAREALQTEMTKLRQTAANGQSTDEQLNAAADAYVKALGQYRDTVQTEDKTLYAQLSPKSRVRCLASGLLDNGLGGGMGMGMGMRMGMPMGGGPGRMGGPGGGRMGRGRLGGPPAPGGPALVGPAPDGGPVIAPAPAPAG